MKMSISLFRQCSKRGFQHWSSMLRASDTIAKPVTVNGPVTTLGSSESLKNPIENDMNKTTNPTFTNRIHHTVGPWDKKFLYWSGQYKSFEDVPDEVDQTSIHKARDWARIRLNLWIIVFATIGCGMVIYFGRDSWRKGQTIEEKNLEWHRKINEEYKREMEIQRQKELLTHPEFKNVK